MVRRLTGLFTHRRGSASACIRLGRLKAPTPHSGKLAAAVLLRKALLCRRQLRKQPERYTTCSMEVYCSITRHMEKVFINKNGFIGK